MIGDDRHEWQSFPAEADDDDIDDDSIILGIIGKTSGRDSDPAGRITSVLYRPIGKNR